MVVAAARQEAGVHLGPYSERRKPFHSERLKPETGGTAVGEGRKEDDKLLNFV